MKEKRKTDFTRYIINDIIDNQQIADDIFNQLEYKFSYSTPIQQTILENIKVLNIPINKNVLMILCEKSRIIKNKISADIRKELMLACKNGYLYRIPKGKESFLPEVFCHPKEKQSVMKARNEYRLESLRNIAEIFSN